VQAYVDSGHRSPRRKLLSALRQNLRYQAILLGIFILGLVYIILSVQITSFSNFQSLLIALANTYGIVLVILCMGHGLVAFPRRLWLHSSLETSLREIERAAVAAWENKSDAEDECAAVASEIASWEFLCAGREDDLAQWIRELALRHPDPATQTFSVDGLHLTEDYVSTLARRARVAHSRLLRAQATWNRLLKQAGYLYDLKSAQGTFGRTIEWKVSQPGRWEQWIPKSVQYIWFLDVLPWGAKFLAGVATVVSAGIVWSEIVHNWDRPLFSLVGMVIRAAGTKWFLLEV
jgi:LMBR1-like membrane protein